MQQCCAGAMAALVIGQAAPVRAITHTVSAGGDLQAALNAAQPGDVILVQAGATFVGNFTLPLKSEAATITIRSSAADGVLPGPTVRITPAFRDVLPKLQSPNSDPVLKTAPGAHHWRLQCLELLANQDGAGEVLSLGAGGSAQTVLSQVPHDLVLDRIYLHGDPVNGQKRGIALNSGSTTITNSYISDIKATDQDSQAIAGWNGPGPYRIENNYLEAAGENVLFGGADPGIKDLVPSDITFRRNHLSKPLEWRGSAWTIKNIFELKNAQRVTIDGNLFENCWVAGQTGYAILFTPRNQGGTAPWTIVQDVTFTNNIVRHSSSAFNILGYDDEHSSQQTKRITISNTLLYDIDAGAWGGDGNLLLIGAKPADIVIEHNTILHSGAAIVAYFGRAPSPQVIVGFVFRNNLLKHNAYGVIGEDHGVGNDSIRTFFPGGTFQRNVLAGGASSDYPADNLFPSVASFMAQFTDPTAGNFRLLPGSSYLTAATDGASIGVDISALAAAQVGVASRDDRTQPERPKNLRIIK